MRRCNNSSRDLNNVSIRTTVLQHRNSVPISLVHSFAHCLTLCLYPSVPSRPLARDKIGKKPSKCTSPTCPSHLPSIPFVSLLSYPLSFSYSHFIQSYSSRHYMTWPGRLVHSSLVRDLNNAKGEIIVKPHKTALNQWEEGDSDSWRRELQTNKHKRCLVCSQHR